MAKFSMIKWCYKWGSLAWRWEGSGRPYQWMVQRRWARIFTVVPSDITRGSEHTLRHRRFPLNIRTDLLAECDQVLSPCLSKQSSYLPKSWCIYPRLIPVPWNVTPGGYCSIDSTKYYKSVQNQKVSEAVPIRLFLAFESLLNNPGCTSNSFTAYDAHSTS